jgi:hypothetical protein
MVLAMLADMRFDVFVYFMNALRGIITWQLTHDALVDTP